MDNTVKQHVESGETSQGGVQDAPPVSSPDEHVPIGEPGTLIAEDKPDNKGNIFGGMAMINSTYKYAVSIIHKGVICLPG